jgi:uncharacterized damage-inducible protein DinB
MDLNPYAKFLGDQDPIPVLTTTADRLKDLTAKLSGAQVNQPPVPGKWSIREIIAHLADCELVFSIRLRQALAEQHAVIQPFDQEIWAQRYAPYDLTAALTLFQATRNWNIRLLSTATEDDRRRPTTHPERGTMTFWTIVETMAGHDINHVQQIERLTADATPPYTP